MRRDSNSNRLFADPLGTPSHGCQCHAKWWILWDGHDISDFDMITDHPKILVKAYGRLRTGDEIRINDDLYQSVSCGSVSESRWVAFNDLEDDLREKGAKEGYHIVFTEFACFVTSTQDGDEGDGDHVFVILNEEPLSEEEMHYIDSNDYMVSGER